VQPGLFVVDNAGKPAPQLDGSRKLALLATPLGPEGPSFLKLGHQNLEPVDQQASNVDTPA
jgi:hypothetical protein